MSNVKIDTGGGNVLDCVEVVEAVVMRYGDEVDAGCWRRILAILNPGREKIARAICAACGENPEHTGDAQGNAKRWQDYLEVADRYIATMAGSPAPESDNARAGPATLEELTRYDLCVDGVGNHTICPCPDGEFVLASDVAGIVGAPKGKSEESKRGEVYLVVHKQSGYVASIATSPVDAVGDDHRVTRYVPDQDQDDDEWQPADTAPEGVPVLTWHSYHCIVANPEHPAFGRTGMTKLQAKMGSLWPSSITETGTVTHWKADPASRGQPREGGTQ